jgi:hypothetical protein
MNKFLPVFLAALVVSTLGIAAEEQSKDRGVLISSKAT